jgi:hypothetical protein
VTLYPGRPILTNFLGSTLGFSGAGYKQINIHS